MDNKEIFRFIFFNVMREIAGKFPAYANFGYEDLLPEAICPDLDERLDYCLNTMNWLQDNGYIKVIGEELPVHGWEMVMPTEKMLALMNVEMPGRKKRTFSAAVLELGKNAAKDAIQEMMKDWFLYAAQSTPLLVSAFLMR